MFYGNSSISTDQSNKTAVWDGNYKGVWHLSDYAGNEVVAEATSNGNTGTNQANTNARSTTGEIAAGLNYNGTTDYTTVTYASNLRLGITLSIEMWVKRNGGTGAYRALLVRRDTNGSNSQYTLYFGPNNTLEFWIYNGSWQGFTGTTAITDSNWHFIAFTWDGSSAKSYIDGSLDKSSPFGYTPNESATAPLCFATDQAYSGRNLPGTLDEVRLSGSTRSADWVATEYNNQSGPATFYTVGSAAQGTLNFSITGLTPTAANFGDSVVIAGTNFGSAQGTSTVSLNGVNVAVQSWGNTAIQVSVPYGASSGYLNVTINSQTAISPPLTVRAMASGFSDGDIGSVGHAGSASYANGVITVNTGGGGIGGAADGMSFVYQTLAGDGTIVARVANVQAGYYATAGVMIRATLDPGAANAFVNFRPNQAYLEYRASAGANTTTQYIGFGAPAYPYWVKLVRSGNAFTGSISLDGTYWTQIGGSQTISMAQTVYIGLAACSCSTGYQATATFDNVSISSTANPAPVITSLSATSGSVGSQVLITGTGFGASQNASLVTLNGSPVTVDSWTSTEIVITIPSGATSGLLVVSVAPSLNDSNPVEFTVTTNPLLTPWLDQDVNTAGEVGSASFSNGIFTVNGAGGIGGSSDSFHFVYQPLSGDGTIVARLTSLQGTSGYQGAGVMIRETMDPGSTYAYTERVQGYLNFYYRTTAGGNSSSAYGGVANLPYWLKLVRSGSTFSSFTSWDGVNWVQLGTSQTINMAQNVYVGLAVANGNNSALATATFDSVSISSTANPGPVITSVSGTTGSVGSQVAINGSGFGAVQGGSLVTLNNVTATTNFWSSTSIIITIPSGATSGPLLASVAPSMNDSNPVYFTVTANPLPTPWLDQDIGTIGITGSASYSNGTFTANGAGQGIGGSSDSFHFVYQPLSGDGSITARVVSLQGNTSPEAGVMIRETLSPGSTYAATMDGGYFYFFYRATTGGNVSESGQVSVPPLPYWAKVIRTGSTFTSFGSSDGVNWVQIGPSQTVSMAQNTYAGLSVMNGTNSAVATATLDNVTVTIGTTPIVTGVSPDAGGTGTSVTITGSNFGATQGTNTVSFNGVQATSVTSWSNTQIVAAVPSTTPSGPGPVTVTVNSITSPASITFTAIHPIISSLTPPAAQPGGFVTLNGSGFGGLSNGSAVYFNGVAAQLNAYTWSNTSVTVPVPGNATSGPVTLTTDYVSSNGVQFTVLEPLTVTGISPSSGPVAGTVTITGTGFGATQSSSTAIFFSSVAATVTSWSDAQIVATVPAGVLSGQVGVCVASQCVWGPSFTLTQTQQLTDSLGNQTSYTSALIGGQWVASSSQGSGCSSCTLRGTISSTYDARGNVLTRTDENGHTTSYTYDSNNNVLTVTAPINSTTSATTTYTYNSLGEVLTTTDPMGFVTTNTYDANGNLLTVTTPAPNGNTAASETQFAYNSLGELTQITDPLNNVTRLTYTSAGLIATITDAQNNVTTYGYDTHGNRTSVTDALNHQTTFTYDSMDRLTKITYPDTTTTQFAYDYRGRRTSVTDQNSKVTTYAYDDADRLITVTDAASNLTTYGYDTENNLTSIKDANNNTTSFSYDAFGRVTQTTFPSGNYESYGYDAVGNLTSKTDRKNQQITYTYDQLNRLTEKTYPDTSTVNYTYDNDSRLTQVTDPTGTYQFTFDNMGRLTNTTTSYAFLTGRNFATAYGYDAASNRTGFTDPESGASSYGYDTLNRLQTLTPPSVFVSSGNFGFSYDALSRRTQMTRPNGLKSIYAYDNLSRLTSVLHQSGSTTLDGAAYAVDNAGNRTSRTPQPSGTVSNYTYDAIYELTQVTQGSSTTESYSYDPVGNRLSSLGVSSYTNNTSNELTSTSNGTYTYDYDGNLLTKTVGSNTTSYAWDFENRLTQVTLPGTGGTVQFKYDPFGRRIYKSSSSATSIYAYDGDNLVEETNASGTAVARYADGLNIDEPLAMLRAGATSFYHADGLGSVTSLSSSAGSIANTYTYDSFGNLTASTGSLTNPFQYTARENDAETGLYYYRARYYDPNSGRFLSVDPVGFRDGPNLYTYVHNKLPSLNDPFGLSAGSAAKCFVKCGVSGAAGALLIGGLAVGAAALGAPVAVVTGALGAVGVIGGVIFGVDVIGNIRNADWDGLACNLGSLAGGSLVGGIGGRAMAEGINGVPSPPWSLASDIGDVYNPNFVDPATGEPGSLGKWWGKGPSPGSAAGSAALGGTGAATGFCGCR